MSKEVHAIQPVAPSHFSEAFEAPGQPRAHWRRVIEKISGMPPEEIRDRLRSVQRQVRENGVTYNVYADPQGADRPWDLDVLPFIVDAREWAGIEAAVVQRARLLDGILDDVYGERRLLQEGLLPAALVHGHSGYLRPAVGVPVPGGIRLHLYAVDLARSPDGQWWVVDDRTQAPSGAGYALENRLVISRLFPDLFRDMRVQRLAGFFSALRESLFHWAPAGDGQPLTVLLTPGPLNETYFEHAYLARYLGFPLVEGGDLTVRDGKVWLKTLPGLRRVHAILRRLDDDYCDPLELRSDSALGIPGLMEAVRRGGVLVANALGSNLLESGAMLGYLPRICQRLLGEPLRMPSVATWWCGEQAAMEHVVRHLDQLTLRPVLSRVLMNTLDHDLASLPREQLVKDLYAQQNHYIAQEIFQLSRSPVVDPGNPGKLPARATSLRVYACATPNGYVVMPGGLTRIAGSADSRAVSMQRGGSSKDTWVISTGPVSGLTLLRDQSGPQDLVRTGVNLSSRVTENLFWFGRYAERSDASARLLRAALSRIVEEAHGDDDGDAELGAQKSGWPAIVALLRSSGILTEEDEADDDVGIVRALRAAIVDDSRPGLASNLSQLQAIASQLRERMSADNWRVLNQLTRGLPSSEGPPLALLDALARLDRTVVDLMTLAGFALDGMSRDLGWRFLSIGRRSERLQAGCAMLREALTLHEDSELDWLLELFDSTLTYRSRYRDQPRWMPVLDLLIRDESNPRSLAFQLTGLHGYMQRLSIGLKDPGPDQLAPVLESLSALDPEADLRHGSETLMQALEDWHAAVYRLSEQLELRFFSHSGELNRQNFAS